MYSGVHIVALVTLLAPLLPMGAMDISVVAAAVVVTTTSLCDHNFELPLLLLLRRIVVVVAVVVIVAGVGATDIDEEIEFFSVTLMFDGLLRFKPVAFFNKILSVHTYR
uniref:Amino acid transporter transmembrane domain-containing protein n=1 Tax=Glossina austeni TaxID=7395 RepID=A0A1A9ULQ6_GLOAU